ncbi:hypothetical protein VTN49DRAFT_2496 [Thermomyces lanuginosus]|uniref:uncharacterized protein n=1 Tax=Thermomyces lanuginosus TaxID=5541 RepID=UPI0037437D9B
MSVRGIGGRRWQRLSVVSVILCVNFMWFLFLRMTPSDETDPSDLQTKYPLLWNHVHTSRTSGGAFYIPPAWQSSSEEVPETVLDAARLAQRLANVSSDRSIAYSEIPLIIHQTWKNTRIDTWTKATRDMVESWLQYAVETPMAYIMWDDDGVMQFMEEFEPEFVPKFNALTRNVERSDIFRILVPKHIGGIYGDLDTHPLRPPATWIEPKDLLPWEDTETGVVYSSKQPVRAIFGIEADCPPDSDSYWRMGYTNPVQLTQWALAAAPGHPVLSRFMERLNVQLDSVASRHSGDLTCPEAQKELHELDPLLLTGPDAVTKAVQSWFNETVGLRWNALTGLHDGGKSKLVDDVMILPITGFSPGRGRYGNMGSKPIDDHDARLQHLAQGSWRSFNLQVEFGKFCRTFFGLCRDWPKV